MPTDNSARTTSSGKTKKTVRGEMRQVGGGTRGVFLLAILAVIAGAGLWIYQASQAGATSGSGKPIDPALVSGLAGSSARTAGNGSASTAPRVVAGPAMVQIGASFIAAFAAGFLLRSFVKWGILLVGMLVIGVYVLQRTGAINVNWDSLESQTGQATNWIKAQTESFATFVKGAIPSSASAVAGLWAGFRRKLPI